MEARLTALRESMRKLAPAAMPAPARSDGLPTGFGALDRHLRAGGLLQGQVSELAGAPSSGKMALALRALAEQTQAGTLAALVDARGDFYPPAAAALGVDLARLLWARVPAGAASTLGDAVRAAEILARARAFPLIALDLPAGARLLAPQARRLRAAAQRSGSALLVLTERAGTAEGASARVELTPAHTSPSGRRVRAVVSKGSATGAPPRAELTLPPIRIDDAPPTALPAANRRIKPGVERPVSGEVRLAMEGRA
jgi:hypothetical protein